MWDVLYFGHGGLRRIGKAHAWKACVPQGTCGFESHTLRLFKFMKSIKEAQEEIKKFCKENNLESPAEHRVLDVMSELGEVAKEILKMSDYGRKPAQYREELKPELGDVLYALITIANSFDVDLEEAFDMVLDKYKKRLKKGSADSKNEERR